MHITHSKSDISTADGRTDPVSRQTSPYQYRASSEHIMQSSDTVCHVTECYEPPSGTKCAGKRRDSNVSVLSAYGLQNQ